MTREITTLSAAIAFTVFVTAAHGDAQNSAFTENLLQGGTTNEEFIAMTNVFLPVPDNRKRSADTP